MRILLVEDEEGVAKFVKKGLEEENYAVDFVDSGDDGLSLGLEESYDLIILDVMLPEMDGITVCRTLREKGVRTPILMLTAKTEVKDKVAGLDSGADDYLTKPFSFQELLARMRALLRRKETDLVELKTGELRIDVLSHRTYVGENEIILRPKEYAILEYLVRNKGRILSRTQILENVWGYDFDPNTNVVDVHIKSLRDKAGDFFTDEFIRTVRGMGYMIAE